MMQSSRISGVREAGEAKIFRKTAMRLSPIEATLYSSFRTMEVRVPQI